MLHKIIIVFFSIAIVAIPCFIQTQPDTILYDTSFLHKIDKVHNLLIQKGFQEVTFYTPDGIKLSGLFLARKNAQCNVVVGAGFLPGKKENVATFYNLLPHNCNILLFDARGHGNSQGPLLRTMWHYGVTEYKDFLGAISCVRHFNNLPIFLCGICSGAYNAARAVVFLSQHNLIDPLQIKGLIFDSGWGSVPTISHSVFMGGIERRLLAFFMYMRPTKSQSWIEKSLSYTACCFALKKGYSLLHSVIINPLMMLHDKETNLFTSIRTIMVPILFIHSYDDTCASIEQVHKLAADIPCKECWWITQESYHAKHHIKHRETYAEKMNSFISRTLLL